MTDVRNLQGDVVAIYCADGNVVAEYRYDAWGNHLAIEGGEIAHINPIRYRGYYWDAETQLYYLQSRYYCPALRRFISADVYLDTGVGILGTNVYIYCNNDPVNLWDPDGRAPLSNQTMQLRQELLQHRIELQIRQLPGVMRAPVRNAVADLPNNIGAHEVALSNIIALNTLISDISRITALNSQQVGLFLNTGERTLRRHTFTVSEAENILANFQMLTFGMGLIAFIPGLQGLGAAAVISEISLSFIFEELR